MSAGGARRAWMRALEAVQPLERTPAPTLFALLEAQASDRPALLGADEQLSYRDLLARANQVARWARPGETVGLCMANRPDYVAIWLGLIRAGCTVALLNTNLSGEALLHGIRIGGVQRLIVDAADDGVLTGIPIHAWPALRHDLERLSDAPLERPPPAPGETALLVYTSGTTGPSKAARLTHARILEWSLWFAGMMEVGPGDRLYDCLPLYHSTGGVVGIGAMLVRGGSVRIADGFSARRFWDDVVDSGCTLVLYIGELCRYLVQSPPHRRERAHRLRLAVGNGLRAEVWRAFTGRFAIPQVLEFYAATEGVVSLYNCEGEPGAIGRVPPFLAARFPFALIRVDPDSLVPLRDAEGRCIRCGTDEPGEAIGPVDPRAAAPARHFAGYTDPDASSAKLLRDVFAAGDCWFRTGDLMRRDPAGFIRFVDRLGDTFRWKGENVATTDVVAVVRACPGVLDAAVYGVTVPGQEGRAGMAAIVAGPGFSLEALAAELGRLPSYAQPVFVRLCQSLQTTGTFKLGTTQLAREGWAGLGDPVWFHDRGAGRFVPCGPALAAAIADGTQRT